jgi:hypothetical protein
MNGARSEYLDVVILEVFLLNTLKVFDRDWEKVIVLYAFHCCQNWISTSSLVADVRVGRYVISYDWPFCASAHNEVGHADLSSVQ